MTDNIEVKKTLVANLVQKIMDDLDIIIHDGSFSFVENASIALNVISHVNAKFIRAVSPNLSVSLKILDELVKNVREHMADLEVTINNHKEEANGS